MKWFRHENDARRNKKIQWVCDQLGPDAGYARIFKLYEIFSAEWSTKNSPVPSLKIKNGPGNLQFFSKELGISEEEVVKTLKILSKAGIIDAASWKEQVVYIPKLAEYTNEWFGKGKSPEGLGRVSGEPTSVHNITEHNSTGQYGTLSKAQYPETKIAEIWEQRSGRTTEPKNQFKKELKELIRVYGEDEVLSQFEIWATLNNGNYYKRPISAFIKQYTGTATVNGNLFNSAEINDLAVELSFLSGGDITFNRLNLNGLAILLRDFSQDELITAFKKFYSENEQDPQWAAKDFVEKAPQLILVARKQQTESARRQEEIERIKAQVQSESQSTTHVLEAETAKSGVLEQDTIDFFNLGQEGLESILIEKSNESGK